MSQGGLKRLQDLCYNVSRRPITSAVDHPGQRAAMPRREREPHEIVHINLRLREALRRQLASEAERHHTSLNNEIVLRLQDSLQPPSQLAEAMVAKLRREGVVLAGWLENELRTIGVDEEKARSLTETLRAYLGR
jgi:Arc-like DNA binding dprotein